MNRLLKAASALLCVVGLSALGQTGVRFDSRATTVQTNMPAGANAPVLAIPGAKVLICTTSDCSITAPIYQDQALTIAAPNPLTAGGASPANLSGQFGFWAAAGTYYYKITKDSTTYGPYPITLGGASSGPGGPTTLTGDVTGTGTGTVPSTLATIHSPIASCGDPSHTSQIAVDGKGRVTSCLAVPIASSGGTSATETPGGAINGGNTIFTLTHTPTLLLLNLNGLLMTPGFDYGLSGSTITMTTIPQTGDKLFASYFYGSSGSLTPFAQTPSGTMNGSNTAFTLAQTPAILFLSVNGVQLQAGTDYTLSGTSLTMTVAPQSGDTFNAQYFY